MFVAVGELEDSPLPYPGMNGQSMVDVARNFSDALRTKGYDVVTYREEPSGHDYITARRALIPGLQALIPMSGR